MREPGAQGRTAAQGRPTGAELVVHPATGELVGRVGALDAAPAEALADAYHAIEDRARELAAMKKAVGEELARRLDMRGRHQMAVGGYELHRKERNESVWDPDELDAVVRRLVAGGVVDPGELTGLITTQTVVSRSSAQRLVDRLAGSERRDVEACRRWKKSVSGVEVVPSIPLLPE